MSGDLTLTPETHAVLQSVPVDWRDVRHVEHEIAHALTRPLGEVRRRLQHLRTLGLIEYRRRQTVTPTFEIRRLAKD